MLFNDCRVFVGVGNIPIGLFMTYYEGCKIYLHMVLDRQMKYLFLV